MGDDQITDRLRAGGSADLYVVNADDPGGLTLQRITRDRAFDSSLAWQPPLKN